MADRNLIKEMYNEGFTYKEIGAKVGISPSRTHQIVKQMCDKGEVKKGNNSLKLNDKYKKVLEMYNEGFSYNDIGKELDLHYTRIGVMVRSLIASGYTKKRKQTRKVTTVKKKRRTDEVYNEEGLKCTCKTSNTCVFGFSFKEDRLDAPKCDFICVQGHSRPKFEDGLCHSYQKITKENPRRNDVNWTLN